MGCVCMFVCFVWRVPLQAIASVYIDIPMSLTKIDKLRPFQINSLFPILDSGIFTCGRAVHFHYSITRLAAFQAIICLAQPYKTAQKYAKLVLSFTVTQMQICALIAQRHVS